MLIVPKMKRPALATALAMALVATGGALPAAAAAQPMAAAPANAIDLSAGTGRLVRLDSPMSDLFVANDAIADVQVRSANQIYIFGKASGETTVYATNKAGRTVYSATVRVGNNIGSIGDMLSLTMPDAKIVATPMNGLVLLTGTVHAPDDAAEAERLVQAFVGDKTQVISRLKTATPLQVMLKVKIAEVSRSLMKNIGVNLLTRDTTSGFLFGITQGRNIGTITPATGFPNLDASSLYGLPAGSISLPFNPATGQFITSPNQLPNVFSPSNPVGDTTSTAINAAGHLLGLDILAALDLSENDGLVTTLAEPTLTALSGETASFLAGGEFPIATSSGLNGTSIEFKEYGVSLAFTPTVLEGGRISMRVRPEVSELTSEGAITLGGTQIPALTTRRAETTVELGSGQSFMIGGLMRNSANNAVDKAPFLGDLPILGALFRSTGFKRNETELVIVVTPYLVKPVNANQIALPTDGYRSPDDAKRLLLDQANAGRSGEQRPQPRVVAPQTVAPGIGVVGAAAPMPAPPARAPIQQAQRSATPAAKPGFSF